MTAEELKVFANRVKKQMDGVSRGRADQLNITENRLYIDNIQIELYDCRSTGRDSNYVVQGIIVFVDEEHLFKYLAAHDCQEGALHRIMELFYEKHYVSFEFVDGEYDVSADEFLVSLKAKYDVNMTFIIDGVVTIQDGEQDIEIKARLQYADNFAECYTMIKETFEFAKQEGNKREFESMPTVVVRKNALSRALLEEGEDNE